MTTSGEKSLVRQRRVGRPSIATPWTATIESWLTEDRGLPSGEIVRRLREEHGYAGGKSAVYELVRRLRPVPVAPVVRFEGVAGEFSQHDFGQVHLHYANGRHERIRFFASKQPCGWDVYPYSEVRRRQHICAEPAIEPGDREHSARE